MMRADEDEILFNRLVHDYKDKPEALAELALPHVSPDERAFVLELVRKHPAGNFAPEEYARLKRIALDSFRRDRESRN